MKKLTPQVVLGYGIWAVSFVIGFIIAYLIVFVWLDTTMERYGTMLFLLTAGSIAMVFVIWMDYFLGTKILPD